MSHLPLPAHLNKGDAEAVLRFIISRAGLYALNSALVRDVAKKCELRADVLSRFLREGHFTPKAAMKIENGLGREYVHWEWLVNPQESVRNGSLY